MRRDKEKLARTLVDVKRKQDLIADQVAERLIAGQLQIAAFDRLLEDLQKQRNELEGALVKSAVKRKGAAKTFVVNPSMYSACMYSAAMAALTKIARTGNTEHDEVLRRFNFIRDLVQKVLIVPSADGKAADLTVASRMAFILASMQAFQEYSAGLRERHANEFARRVRAGEFSDINEKLDFTARFCAVLAEEEADWKRLQVSLVAGAGFEPAAFRL
ncbi:hypothetical protein [Pararhizobium antarcticum]|uniref:Uncharacterized protein n=1 Tax=Pararhizobium antarcticum TaxID=1798805 RepID=A0A657LZV2_9HYPH|nr:hypothetical protein [Pararhizobium antarcticum]OJF95658.1 hypothetical protein AX761_17085 [Rhizobium sp. 58]OJF99405.1 hypothetical protein AX760_13035 [Pararhizobium antarcticum]